jgi:phage terminase large subunit-like protein
MNEPAKEFERLVVAHRVAHGDNPVMNWMVANATVVSDPAGNIKPTKEKSTGRIDGVVAAVMAVGMIIRGHETEQEPLLYVG